MAPRTEAQNEALRTQRRGDLLQAAQRVFASNGFHAANISDVAAEAKVSQGTVYHYFDSQEALLEKWLADRVENIVLHIPSISLGCRSVFVLPKLEELGGRVAFKASIGVPLWPFIVFVIEKT